MSKWIDQEKERNKLTIEALADVDAGLVIDDWTVQVWAASLETNKPIPEAEKFNHPFDETR